MEPLPDWIEGVGYAEEIKQVYLRSTVQGQIDKNKGYLEFIKKYQESAIGLDYEIEYRGVLKGPYITGQYSVNEVAGPFELLRENS